MANLVISEYIVPKRTTPACSVQYLDVITSNKKCENISSNSQLNCGSFPFAKTAIISADISDAQILTDNIDSKTVLELTLNIKNTDANFDYFPGDSIGILPQNSNEDVDFVLESLGYCFEADRECTISIKNSTTKSGARVPFYIPLKSTPRQIIRDCLSIRSIPKKLFCISLVEYTSNDIEKAFLESISAKEGSQIYSKLSSTGSMTFLNLLRLCPSCKPPFNLLLEHLPRLLPRPYSIANSPLTSKDSIKIIFSVLRSTPGITTKMLQDKVEDHINNRTNTNQLYIYLREPNIFRYTTEDYSNNSIMISIGCGISPFLGFLEHKKKLMENLNNQGNAGITWAITGFKCISEAIYRNQLINYKTTRVLNEIYESFSKHPESDFKYVQDQIKENAEDFVGFLTKFDATLYVCADGAEISKSIEVCVKECMSSVLEESNEAINEFILQLKKIGKYREDIW